LKVSKGARILLVDDEVSIRNLYQLFLESSGYSVVAASSIAEALRYLRNEQFSLALIDIYLGEDSGIDLLKGIVSAGVALPVIVISGMAAESPLFAEALANGAAALFYKAQPLTRLLGEIEQVLQRRSAV
jgi:DNA-binding NtrC family response regulator